MEKIILVDAYAHIYRSFYGVRGLSNSQGQPTNAIYAMVRFLFSLEDSLPSAYGAVTYDLGKCSRRCELLPEYKAQRPPMPDALRCQLGVIREFVEAFGWPVLLEEGREADDLMAAVAVSAQDCQVDILSFDKDLSQLVNSRIAIVSPGKNNTWLRLDEAGVREKFGVSPSQIRDYLALLGDSADNIPGVPGVGPKTAVKLLEQYGSVAGLASAGQAVLDGDATGRKVLSALADGTLERNCQLVALDTRLPQGYSGLESLRRRSPDWQKISELCAAQDFRSFVEKVQGRLTKTAPATATSCGENGTQTKSAATLTSGKKTCGGEQLMLF